MTTLLHYDGSSSGLVAETENIEAWDGTGVLGGLKLGDVEVGGDRDDSVCHGLAEPQELPTRCWSSVNETIKGVIQRHWLSSMTYTHPTTKAPT